MRPALAILCVALIASSCGGEAPGVGPVDVRSLAPGEIRPGTPATFKAALADLRGTPVVVNFWASWCGPCRKEMPLLAAASERYAGRVRFLGVDVRDAQDDARAFVREFKVAFGSIGDPQGDIQRDQGVLGLPATHFYAADGRRAFVHAGEINAEELEAKLKGVVRGRR